MNFFSNSSALLVAGLAISISFGTNSLYAGKSKDFDLIIRHGTLYDGSGGKPYLADVAVDGEKIVKLGNLDGKSGKQEIDAHGLAVAPGFINMLSWAGTKLIHDGRSQSDIRQGVTLEVMGEGESMGPLSKVMKKDIRNSQGDIKFPVDWTSLGEFCQWLEHRGVSCNFASFVGAATVRQHQLGEVNRAPTADELERMKKLVARAMEEGAVGVSSALIYAPGVYAKTDELTELAKVASQYNGLYASHMRSEGNRLLEAIDEFISICRNAKIDGEIYHLKAAGQANWAKLDSAIKRIEDARTAGLHISADMYNYTAAATGLDAMMPPWVQEGGFSRWAERLKDKSVRERLIREISTPSNDWENFYLAAGSPEKVLFVGFRNEKLKPLTGKTLDEVARMRGKSAIDTAMDLVIEDNSRVDVVYFLMSEENVRKELRLPWVSFCSDAGSYAAEGIFLKSSTHPRAYGNFARLLGKYVRDEKVVTLEEAVRRLTSQPAETLKLKNRGRLKAGYFADVVIFDPEKVQDYATFEKPQQYSTGVVHVFVNGTQVLKDGEHTGAKPGKFVRGPGAK